MSFGIGVQVTHKVFVRAEPYEAPEVELSLD